MKVCIVGASGKLGQYMIQHSLDRGYEVVGVCRPASVAKLDAFKERITVIPGATDDREVIQRAVGGCDGVLVVLVPRGVHGYSTGTAQAVLDYALPDARLVFSCGWHISLDGQDVYSWKLKALVNIAGPLAKLARFADLDDQVEACRRVFASDTRWTVVRGSDLEEGESQGASRSGADTWATRFSRATSPGAWTSPCSWSRHSRTTSSSTRRRRSSAASRPQLSLTPLRPYRRRVTVTATEMPGYDVVVVGGGAAGLSAALCSAGPA
jgi:NAD(P)-dependent dehydrogenase (short-subunit alcohol dehydrogenase family)